MQCIEPRAIRDAKKNQFSRNLVGNESSVCDKVNGNFAYEIGLCETKLSRRRWHTALYLSVYEYISVSLTGL